MTEILKFHSVPRWQAPGSTLTGSCGAAGSMAMMERNWLSQKSHVRLLALLRSPRTPGNLHVLSVPLISPILNISHKGKKILVSFTWDNFVKVYPCHSVYQNFILSAVPWYVYTLCFLSVYS